MRKNIKIIYGCELLLLVYTIFLWLRINKLSYDGRLHSAIIVLLFLLIMLLALFGFKKDKDYLKGSSARIVLASMMTFLLVIYSLGFILGFNRGYIYGSFLDFFKIISPVLVINVEIELMRYIIARNSFKSKSTLVVFTIISSILNVLLEVNLGALGSSEEIFIFFSNTVIPIIAGEILCSFMTYKISMLPSLIYKLVIKLYVYLLPIIPNLGNYLYSIFDIVLPFALYCMLNRILIKYEKEKQQLKNVGKAIFNIPLFIFLVVIIILVSGIFKYKLIAIASNSMSPTYCRGDAVIYEKVDVKDLKVGDILAFQKDNIIVTHRIVEIWKKEGKYYFATKGDNNSFIDDFKVPEQNVLGRVQSIFKYIGYPTVLGSDYFRKE